MTRRPSYKVVVLLTGVAVVLATATLVVRCPAPEPTAPADSPFQVSPSLRTSRGDSPPPAVSSLPVDLNEEGPDEMMTIDELADPLAPRPQPGTERIPAPPPQADASLPVAAGPTPHPRVALPDSAVAVLPRPQIGADGQDHADYSAFRAAMILATRPVVEAEILAEDEPFDMSPYDIESDPDQYAAYLAELLGELTLEDGAYGEEGMVLLRDSLSREMPLEVRLQALYLLHEANPVEVFPFLRDPDEFVALEAERLLFQNTIPPD